MRRKVGTTFQSPPPRGELGRGAGQTAGDGASLLLNGRKRRVPAPDFDAFFFTSALAGVRK
jgi:hypothetical protein